MVSKGLDDFGERLLDLVALKMQKDIVLNSPVDTGRLRASVVIKKEPNSRVVGTNVEYAPFIEAGIRGNARGDFKGKDMFLNAALKARQFTQEALARLKATR